MGYSASGRSRDQVTAIRAVIGPRQAGSERGKIDNNQCPRQKQRRGEIEKSLFIFHHQLFKKTGSGESRIDSAPLPVPCHGMKSGLRGLGHQHVLAGLGREGALQPIIQRGIERYPCLAIEDINLAGRIRNLRKTNLNRTLLTR